MNAAEPLKPDRRFQIDALDGIRGLAVLLVFVSHCSLKGVSLFPGTDFSGIGKCGVWLFFLLSSFLLTYPFIARQSGTFSFGNLSNYFFRRVLRVYPLYILYLLCALATTPLLARLRPSVEPRGVPFALNAGEFLAHLALLQGKGVTWSILVEFKFYFLLPILALVYVQLFRRNLWLSLLFTIACMAIAFFIWPESTTNDPRLGPYLPIFFLGSFLALMHWHWQNQAWITQPGVQRTFEVAGWIAVAVLIALIPSVASLLVYGSSGEKFEYNVFHKQFLAFCFLWATVLLATVYGSGGLRALFASYILRFFGFISFSFYLIHVVVLNALNELWPNLPGLGWLILAVTTAVSYLSYRIVEKPLSALRLKSAARS